MLKPTYKLTHFALLMSGLNFIFFHLPFYRFVIKNVEYTSFSGIINILLLALLMLVVNAFVFYILLYLLRFVGRSLIVLFFILNAVAVYLIKK
jgi:lipid A ethanolaminephosphotransferase